MDFIEDNMSNKCTSEASDFEIVSKHRKTYKRYKQPSFVSFNSKIHKYTCHCYYCKDKIQKLKENINDKKEFYNNKYKTLKDVYFHIEQTSSSLLNNVLECKVCKKYGTIFYILNKKRELDDHNKEFHSKEKWEKIINEGEDPVSNIENSNIFSNLEE